MEIEEKFKEKFGGEPDIIVRAPGRVNLIGEHTDYNDGFVMPVAIDKFIWLAARLRDDKKVSVYSIDFDQSVSFSLDNIEFDNEFKWSNYIRGVADVMIKAGHTLNGVEAVVTGNVPQGAGLSSSAAIEVATAFTFDKLNNLNIEATRLALLCQKAENEFVGMNCGIMDQFISRLAKRDCALFLDCRDLSYRLIPMNFTGVKILICNTGVSRGLVDSEYNRRRSQCEEGVKILQEYLSGIKALRDVSVEDFEKWGSSLPEEVRKRCHHVVYEDDRVLKAIGALEKGDIECFGGLLYESHHSLRDYYEVSCKELDIMVEIARSIEGVFGARMTGAGFGGCTVNLVKSENVQEFEKTIKDEYYQRAKLKPQIHTCIAEGGAKALKI